VPLVVETTSSPRQRTVPSGSCRGHEVPPGTAAAKWAARFVLIAVIERHRVTLIKVLVALLTFVVVVHSLDLVAAAHHHQPR
jgi:hypothetical protein